MCAEGKYRFLSGSCCGSARAPRLAGAPPAARAPCIGRGPASFMFTAPNLLPLPKKCPASHPLLPSPHFCLDFRAHLKCHFLRGDPSHVPEGAPGTRTLRPLCLQPAALLVELPVRVCPPLAIRCSSPGTSLPSRSSCVFNVGTRLLSEAAVVFRWPASDFSSGTRLSGRVSHALFSGWFPRALPVPLADIGGLLLARHGA